MRMLPPPSLAVQSGTIPAVIAEALPPLDPPEVSSGAHGLPVAPKRRLSVYGRKPNSGVFVFPMMTTPAARSRATDTESSAAIRSSNAREPEVSGIPATASRSFTPSGTPANSPGSSPAATRASMVAACARAPFAST